MSRQFYVYIMTNRGDSVLYTGVTSDLKRRVYEHRHKLAPGFTSRYRVVKLVYYEVHGDARCAISREKQLKAGPRREKLALVRSANPEWLDLYEEL